MHLRKLQISDWDFSHQDVFNFLDATKTSFNNLGSEFSFLTEFLLPSQPSGITTKSHYIKILRTHVFVFCNIIIIFLLRNSQNFVFPRNAQPLVWLCAKASRSALCVANTTRTQTLAPPLRQPFHFASMSKFQQHLRWISAKYADFSSAMKNKNLNKYLTKGALNTEDSPV